jgi:hypothetical protein
VADNQPRAAPQGAYATKPPGVRPPYVVTESSPVPAIRTRPSNNKVAVWRLRAVVMLPVAGNVPGDCALAIGLVPAYAQYKDREIGSAFISGLLNH